MSSNIKDILNGSFYQIFLIYSLSTLLISLSLFSKYSLQLQILAIVIASFSLSIKPSKNINISKNTYLALFFLSLFFILLIRLLPYTNSTVPIGYDSGLYKYAIESGLQNKDLWILSGGMEPGFLYFMSALAFIPTHYLLTIVFIFFNIILGISLYFLSRVYFGRNAALFSLVFYSLSLVQFIAFTYLYYKNIIALALMLTAFSILKLYEKYKDTPILILFVFLGVSIASIHRPTFYLFSLSYLIYSFFPKENFKEKLLAYIPAGIAIIFLSFLFYLSDFFPAITSVLPSLGSSFISPGESPGTFISFQSYLYSVLPYLPFSLIALFHLVKKKEFSILVIWTILNLIIVYFQFFFFNRFIIFLDVAFIVLSGLGVSLVLDKKNYFSVIVLSLLLFSASFLIYSEAQKTESLISENTLSLIEKISEVTPPESQVISISSEYSPYLLAWSNRTVIAPGLFDNNPWNNGEWDLFWSTESKEETQTLASKIGTEEELYIFSGTKIFNNPCFTLILEENQNRVYKYTC